jgi:phosphoglycerate dehydrogenase-like enzyme
VTAVAWVPHPAIAGLVAELPGVTVQVYEGGDEHPADVEAVEFYVPPFPPTPQSADIVAKMTGLRVVQMLTAGVDAVRGVVPEGVTLCNARGAHNASTAEWVVGAIVACQRDFPAFAVAQRDRRWDWRFTDSLADKSVLIVGYGSIGASIESRLSGFEANVVRVARSARDGVHSVSELPELLPLADIVILIVPSTDETTGMADAEFLAQMKDGALLVNAARGPVVDTAALLAELEAGRLRAALDVTDPEPLPEDHPLWVTPGAFITPHVGGSTPASAIRAAALVRDQLTRFAKGEQLHNVITGEY